MNNVSAIQTDESDDQNWALQWQCPSCQSPAREIGPLFMQAFNFAARPVPALPESVQVMRCTACSLIFKSVIAAPPLLEKLTHQSQDSLWSSPYDYAGEIAAVRAVDPDALNDVIDVGAAAGGFLAALPNAQRTSALDIVRFDSLRINGEFIRGFLDDETLNWSGEPYSLVGLFDVAEHLYNPTRAFGHLRALCRIGGLVILETGDSDAVAENDLPHWYYINLVEHHLAWNRASLEAIVARTNFEIVSFQSKPHKGTSVAPSHLSRLKAAVYAASPRLMRAFYRLLGKTMDVPASFGRDHMQVILRAI